MRKYLLFQALAILLLFLGGLIFASTVHQEASLNIMEDPQGGAFIADQLLITFKDGVPPVAIDAIVAEIDGRVVTKAQPLHLWVVQLRRKHTLQEIQEVIHDLESRPEIKEAQLNRLGTLF
ncbi:MAG: hypothetical protein SFV18_18220 [Bryobacteraceae bacterium]|nr:hypothetical protein [Bryobacteraceae bacterium]